ncbi:MAG TPA: PPK2 family polyphosphate kinase [Longimicrobiaceae bacterium]|nr:PPK2 family polyphosphate kinase [Longimicrobiaceae bacterium]
MLLSPVRPEAVPPLRDEDAAAPGELPSGPALRERLDELLGRIERSATALYAEGSRAALFILQARDTGGKDGTIRRVFGAVNPQSLALTSFAAPTGVERRHDFLWRVHQAVPAFGQVGVFNRSHYKDVLAARVRRLVPEEVWRGRYEQINDFERILARNGITVVKLFLHVSSDEQRRRLLKRLDRPHKRWKFDPTDLEDRMLWDEYTAAYRDVFERCSTEHAPWYVVPADDKHVRDVLVAEVVAETLERMDPQTPEADPEVLAYADQLR